MNKKHVIIVLFGATGDLAKRKLYKSFYGLSKQYDYDVDIIGLGRNELSRDDFIKLLPEGLDYNKINYIPIDYDNLDKRVNSLLREGSEIVIYLSVGSNVYKGIIEGLKTTSFIEKSKIILEKPFGEDVATANELNDLLKTTFTEDQLYRIDHYLGKEGVREVFNFRVNNVIKSSDIRYIEIIANESVGLEGRNDYYDHYGALRDMVQTHLFQVLGVTAGNVQGEFIDKLAVLNSLTVDYTEYGQYIGYTNDLGHDSDTETYVKAQLSIHTPGFDGISATLETGKKLSKKETHINIYMKDDGIYSFNIYPEMNVIYTKDGKINVIKELSNIDTSYEFLLNECILGNKFWFPNWSEINQSWKLVEHLVHCKNDCPILNKY